ncbi:MAG: chromosome segregation protein SMC [Chloroflexota bacterium]|nr:chromosome segregation protein SMC [Chloroflexota bacterium]MDE2931600.1 chromosome segregation protein SMC [Chloroflexota bacterium]
MYLTQLEIQGFKTFPTRTKLAFPQGIAAIVGPNGSGKSNLADAIRWALGEQSMLALRGRKSEDVVFAGTPRRARGSMTEVALTFDNEDGAFPLELAEINIARRAYRSGENEYLLNGNRVRLRDIQQLLADAGIGQGMMIGQGLVDQVLAQRPEDRRVLLEEAAGVRSLYMQEHEAENKLQRVRENMSRVRDILLELEPRLTVLERQAKEAQRAEDLRQELARELHAWYAAQLAQLVAEEQAASQELEQVQATLSTLETQIASRSQERERLEQAVQEQEQGLHRLEARVGGLRNRLNELAQRQAVQQERQTHLSRSVEEAETREAELAERHDAVRTRLPKQETSLSESTETLTTLQAEWQTVRNGITDKEEARQKAEAALQQLRQEGVTVTTRLNSLTAAINDTKRQREALLTRAAEAAEQLQHVRKQQHDRAAALAALREKADTLQAEESIRQTAKEQAASALANVEREFQQLEKERQRPLRRRADLEGRTEALRAILAGAAADEDAKPAAVAARVGVKLLPTLGETDLPADIATAVAAALPSEAFLAENARDAEKLVEHLVSVAAVNAIVLASDLLKAEERTVPKHPGVIGCAADLIALGPESVALEPLLAAILVVKDVGAISSIADRSAWPLIVSVDGVVYGNGVFRFAQASVQRGQQQEQLKKLTVELADVRRRSEELEQKESALRGQRDRLREEAQATAAAYAQSADEARTAAAALQKQTNEYDESARQIAWWEQVEEEARTQREELDDAIAAREREAPLAVAAKERLTREIGERERTRDTLQQEVETQRAEVSSLQTQLAVQQQRKEHLTRAIAQLRTEQQSLLREQSTLAATCRERAEALGALQTELAATAQAATQTAAHAEAAEAERKQQRTALEELRAQHGALVRAIADLENQRTARTVDYGRAEQVLASVQQRREDTILRWLSDEPEAEPVPKAADEPLEELQSRVTLLRNRLRRIGPVNPLAVEEFAELEERATFLREQIADLEAAGQDLDEVKRQLRRTIRQDFNATFQQVAADFRAMVKVLFDGGDADLSLTDPDNPDQTGIEITVRLPGKRRQALSLLSGGERALVALALLFALLSARATPLCLLDEADAMLDETNIGRFCKLLREYGRDTQFLVITHNRGTMEMADALFGVSMAEEGVSQVLSLHLEELREELLAPTG